MRPRSLFLIVVLLLGLLASRGGASSYAPGSLAAAAVAAGVHVGAAIDSNLNAARREIAAREFTSATVENSLKWQPLSPSPGVYDFTQADQAVDWAEQNNLRVRGHTFIWNSLNGKPGWLDAAVNSAPDPAAYLTQLMQTHIQTVMQRYEGRIEQWDVVNEPLATLGVDHDPDSLFYQTLGEQYLDIAFHAARAADPQADLFLNETLAEVIPGKFDGLMLVVQGMQARGVPIDGVGLQGHFFLGAPDPVLLRGQLEEVAALGLLVELTEVDIPISHFASEPDPLAAQAQAYSDVFAACLQVSACTGVTTWGIDDADSWLDNFYFTQANAPNQALLFDQLGEPKPAYDAVVAALLASQVPLLPLAGLGLLAGTLGLLGVKRLRREPVSGSRSE
ncbi:MAG: endo-1,4-beta-xylanase [Myxococcota bacterium]|nr:endo-1,4-beta-xylanase [Myxococcota bacterium]